MTAPITGHVCRGFMLVALLFTPALRAGAQGENDGHDCAKAIRIASIGHPEKKLDWALATLQSCGAQGADAAAHALLTLGAERDTAVLDSLTSPLSAWRDVALLRVGMQMAENQSGTPESRVFALRYLYSLVTPGTTAGYSDMIGATSHPCIGGYTTSGGITETRAVQSSYINDLRALGSRLANSASNTSDVRRAATCLELIRPGRIAPSAQSY